MAKVYVVVGSDKETPEWMEELFTSKGKAESLANELNETFNVVSYKVLELSPLEARARFKDDI